MERDRRKSVNRNNLVVNREEFEEAEGSYEYIIAQTSNELMAGMSFALVLWWLILHVNLLRSYRRSSGLSPPFTVEGIDPGAIDCTAQGLRTAQGLIVKLD